MPLARHASKKLRSFDLPVSYRVNEGRDRLVDALNVYSNQGRLETRYGRSRYNSTTLGGSVLSLSFFKNAAGTKYKIAKVGTVLYAVASSGAHTVLKTGLTSTTKHRGITWARGTSSRHIISIESDGLFQFDGTTFTQLGQAAPSACTIATAAGSLTNGSYTVFLTYYSSSTGFESNASVSSNAVTTVAQGLSITAIPSTAANATIDKVRIYLKLGSATAVYAGEVNLGTTSSSISSNPTSTLTYPLTNAAPLSGGGKYFTEFNRKLVYSGNGTYKNDVYFSEEDMPGAFNDGTGDGRLVLYAPFDGEVTGLATGLYNNSVLAPFLVVFKKRSTHIYSEINGESNFVPISSEIGCVSHETIRVKNGSVYFLSDQGWRVIENGRIVTNKIGSPATLGDGDIDDIFRSPGYAYEVNRTRMDNAFSVYYSTLDQYMTWIAEGGSNDFSKTYVYEYRVGGFKPFQFYSASTCACTGEDNNGLEVVYMADADGFLYTYSNQEDRSDDDLTGAAQAIEAYALLPWMDGDDMDASYNFREMFLRRVAGVGDLTVKAWVNYTIDNIDEYSIEFENPSNGFVLDVSELDTGMFGESERAIITARADINRTGENLLIGFYQNEINKNIGLVSAQIDYQKNGNRNL